MEPATMTLFQAREIVDYVLWAMIFITCLHFTVMFLTSPSVAYLLHVSFRFIRRLVFRARQNNQGKERKNHETTSELLPPCE